MLVAAALAGCGSEDDVAGGGAGAGSARLVVREAPPAAPIYTEGSLAFLRLERVDTGEVLARGRAGNGADGEPLFDSVVAPGRYRLVSHQRPCDGNCGYLDPPVDGCETTVSVGPGESLTATVIPARGGCSVRTRSAR
jgi:hypothetical protein